MTPLETSRNPRFLPAQKPPDRRRAPRRSADHRLVGVEQNAHAGVAHCHNISDTGVKLDVVIPLELNKRVTVLFSPTVALRGKVVWLNGNECGIAFERPIDSRTMLAGSREIRDERTDLDEAPRSNLPVRFDPANGIQDSPNRGTSACAIVLSRAGDFRPGMQVTVMRDGGREQRAMLRWSSENIAELVLLVN